MNNCSSYETSIYKTAPLMTSSEDSELLGEDWLRDGGRYSPSLDQLTYTWKDVNVFVPVKQSRTRRWFRGSSGGTDPPMERRILQNVNGVCRPGELLAVMGASGAGKTTLLNVLTHRNNDKMRVTGSLRVNGAVVAAGALTSQSAYVQQDDLFINLLTVREQLAFQAALRMDRHLSPRQRTTRQEEVLCELGLTNCGNTRISRISGGEIKRLMFACEVLTNPPLMFCDEPTSGLDSFMAQAVVAVMKNMAEKGKTVLATIHQPSSEMYAMFDHIMLIAEGRVAFLGTADSAYQFFNRIGQQCPPNYNPADFFISTLAVQPGQEEECRERVSNICDQFTQSAEGCLVAADISSNMTAESFVSTQGSIGGGTPSPYKARWTTQFRCVLWRSWLETSRDPLLVRVRCLHVVMIAMLLGFIFFRQELTQEGITNINGALFLFLTNMTFQNVFGVINTFCVQLPLFKREHFNGMYRTDVYFVSKTLAELPFFIVLPMVFVSIAYFMVGLVGDVTNFFICAGIVVLVANVSTSFGYVVSCLSHNLSMALGIAVPLIIPMMLFGGFFLNRGSIPPYLSWIRYISWFSYANEALLINQWQNVGNISCHANQTCFPDGQAVLVFLNFDKGSIAEDVICLLALLMFYRILAFLGLLMKAKRK